MTGELILVVDDEPNIIKLVGMYLKREGYRVESVRDGQNALDSVKRFQPALIVLDLMLPRIDGFEVCKKLRADQNDVPIIMLTARDEDIDKIVGLEIGADDYLTKPFNPRELVARVKSILRRSRHSDSAAGESVIQIGDVVIDPQRREVRINDQPVNFRNQEFDLLITLARHEGFVLSRERILQRAWGYDYAGQTRTVDVHVGQLRTKLSPSRVTIETVIGAGYKLVVHDLPSERD